MKSVTHTPVTIYYMTEQIVKTLTDQVFIHTCLE
jgi:hypothetical protein